MVKKTSKVHYLFDGQSLGVVKIYRSLRKKHSKAKVLTATIFYLWNAVKNRIKEPLAYYFVVVWMKLKI